MIASRSVGIISAVFDKSHLPKGDITRKILLETNDPEHPKEVVAVGFFVQDVPISKDVRITPPAVAYGRTTRSEIMEKVAVWTIIVPDDSPDSPAEISASRAVRCGR